MKLKKFLCGMMVLGLMTAQLFGTQQGKTIYAVSATNETQEIGVLGDWENDKDCPDFYGGLRYAGWHIVYLKDNTEANQNMVLDGCPAIRDNIKFKECKYSRNELKTVNDELNKDFNNYKGIQTFGISITDGDSLDYDDIGEPRVLVGILKESYKETSELLQAKYGDKVVTYETSKISVLPITEETVKVSTPVSLTVVFKSVKHKGNKIKLKWKKLSKASKYKVAIYNKKGKKLVSKTTKKSTFTYKIKKKSKKYTVKVKAYNKSEKRWGSWTKETV